MKSFYSILCYTLVVFLSIWTKNTNAQLFKSGRITLRGKHPHAVLVNNGCGGTLIHPSWVLTAGHCTKIFITGYKGVNKIKTADGIRRKASTSITHPRFKVGPYFNKDGNDVDEVWAKYDFALLKLNSPVEPSKKVKPVALNTDETIEPNLKGMIATYSNAYPQVSESHGTGVVFAEIYEGEFETWNDTLCKQTLDTFNKTMMFCGAGYPPLNSHACHGDSGSGFVANNKLYGVASWGEDDNITCNPKGALVFAKVTSVLSWIKKHVPELEIPEHQVSTGDMASRMVSDGQ